MGVTLVAHIEGGTRLRVFENRVLWRILGTRGEEVTVSGENYIMRSLMISTPYTIFSG
jgi:hypothetical protein